MRGHASTVDDGDLVAGDGSPRADALGAVDLLLRVATVIGEIEALKRERHRKDLMSTRVEFAAVYFRKRSDRVRKTEAAVGAA